MSLPTLGDLNFDPLVKVASGRFLHSEVTIFPFIISKSFVGKNSEFM